MGGKVPILLWNYWTAPPLNCIYGWKERGGGNRASVEIRHTHTNFVRIERNGEILLDQTEDMQAGELFTDRTLLNVRDILTFADRVSLEDIESILRPPQIECNTALAERGW